MKNEEKNVDNIEVSASEKSPKKKNIVSIISVAAILGAVLFLLYYHFIQPYFSERATDKYRELINSETTAESASAAETKETSTLGEETDETGEAVETEPVYVEPVDITDAPNYERFSALVNYNSDLRGWISIPGTNIDYPVTQAWANDPEYYLTHNVDRDVDKNGAIFIDYRTVLNEYSRLIFINGHNMKSTGLMFHELKEYKTFEFYQQNPVFTFDNVYGDGQWKIISLLKTNNNEKQGERFNFYRGGFSSDEEFMEFVYQMEVRSIYQCPVSVNEDDQLLILSTCTYDMDDMRYMIVARKVREGEDEFVDTSLAYKKDKVLYPDAWYSRYGGEKPDVTSFETAYKAGEIDWYDGQLYQ